MSYDINSNFNKKPKKALVAYCVLAERFQKGSTNPFQALTPFFSEICNDFAGQFFDAKKFSDEVSSRYALRIPILAALGLAEQLARDGLLDVIKGVGQTVYKYKKQKNNDVTIENPVTVDEIDLLLEQFYSYCRSDEKLSSWSPESLSDAFLDRLLNIDSMRLLSRRETSTSLKRTPNTLGIKTPSEEIDSSTAEHLHLDFCVAQFLINLKSINPSGFEQVSNIAFASMAAEALSCFRDPMSDNSPLGDLTIYLDSPLLLDMLGVNAEYEDYGRELLNAIKECGAKVAIFDDCVSEAESSIRAQLASLRSGINRTSHQWGTSINSDLLSVLSGNVAERAHARLKIDVQSDPENNLHRRSSSTVGTIESEMTRRMLPWGNEDAKNHDRKTIWSLLSLRGFTTPTYKVCDSKFIFLTRNTPLVSIANDAWSTWINDATQISKSNLPRVAPIAMSDKQFSGYLWARSGGSDGAMSQSRLLAHCSAAVRPRADVKARAINLVLELHGSDKADDFSALLEDREGAKALMQATYADPEDVTEKRLPYILERVQLAAGEFAAAEERKIAAIERQKDKEIHEEEIAKLKAESDLTLAKAHEHKNEASILQRQLNARISDERKRLLKVIETGVNAGLSTYKIYRWILAVLFGFLCWVAALMSSTQPFVSACFSFILGVVGFWFVPDFLRIPLQKQALKKVRSSILKMEPSFKGELPNVNFETGAWESTNALKHLFLK